MRRVRTLAFDNDQCNIVGMIGGFAGKGGDSFQNALEQLFAAVKLLIEHFVEPCGSKEFTFAVLQLAKLIIIEK
jgi:hypothetical protein